jgi:TonB family protein
MEQLFRKMIAASVVFHVAALGFATLWAGYYSPPPRFLSVTVIDLVGGEAFAPPPRKQASPVEEPAPPPPEKSVKKEEKEAGAPPPVKVEEKKKSKAKDAPDARALEKSLREMREKKASEERLREKVVAIRREKAARKAVRQIGERVGRRIELSSVQPPKSGPRSPTAGLAGATGNTRVPPEQLAYFRKLDEKIRSNWTVPALRAEEREKLMVRVRIVIEQDGRVSQVRMEKTSGNPYFDDSVRRAINKASPLPVPPEQLRGGEDYYEIGFRFYGAGGGS